ncbi:Demethylmenaquinone methyltransferase [Roseovarius litorisediminis]|uniref:Demethylmenaquinone methyltransferase n=1 Tax=Roseovarius litorisediminis TaxID=1312363 RepID=A0A1Y5SV11_9RHOB|nr:methyltransferase domain-containing protein [Roseovarius litorisediminis]SLN45661.1 Demethylmenaquinone methyltransferase [Roseovarius litorisediminis]
MTDRANQDQAEYWSAQQKWVDHQETLDATLAPVLTGLLEQACLRPGEHVLDIGCGTGASLLSIAQAVGPKGAVMGADISSLLLSRARDRIAKAGCENVRALECDAQIYDFAPASVDCAMSRFGVMFFEDPVAAFANIARALKPGGRLVFLSWADLQKNPWFDVPRQVAFDQLGPLPKPEPRAPGPMAFAERNYVSDILTSAGLKDVSVSEVNVLLTPPDGVAGAAAISTRVGIAARALQYFEGSSDDAHAIEDGVAKAMKKYETPAGMRVPAALNLCTAVRG